MSETSKGPRSGVGHIFLLLKGMAMGAADVVPGVSGGTIAFITGIYEELIHTIKSIDLSLFKSLFTDGIASTWKKLNGTFLMVLFSGILISVASLAKGITFLLETYPLQVWGFFFGLIVASAIIISKFIKTWDFRSFSMLLGGAAIAYFVTIMAPSQIPDGHVFTFLAGSVAICAMILPGVSGSFLLLMLGAYEKILGSISGIIDGLKAMDTALIMANGSTLMVFAFGCLLGLLAFSRFLSWMFKVAYSMTMALLAGFMIGSLNKVWPWKQTLVTYTKHSGEENEKIVPLVQQNVLPGNFADITGEPAHLGLVITLAFVGFTLVLGMDKMAAKNA
jgi:putative membrane protein